MKFVMRIVCYLCIVVMTFVSSGCGVTARVAPSASMGMIDLGKWDLEKNGNVILGGEWEFYWKDFVSPGGFSGKSPGYVKVPGSWDDFVYSGSKVGEDGFATYRLSVTLDRAYEKLAMEFSDVATAYALIINGIEVASRGKVGTDEKSSVPHKAPHFAVFTVNDSRLDIVIHVSNFHEKNGGIWYRAPVLGIASVIVKQQEFGLLLQGIVAGCMIIIGFFHLSMFLLRREDLPSLFFFFFCMAICIRLPVMGDSFLIDRFFDPGWEWIYRLQYFSFFLAVPLFNIFVYMLFKSEYSVMVCRILVGISAVFICFSLFAGPKFLSHALGFFDILTNAYVAYLVLVIVRAFRAKREGAVIFLVGYLVFGTSVLNDILNHNHIIATMFLLPVGVFVFVVTQSLLISLRFVNTYNKAKVFSAELEDYSRNLELKVAERTKRLEAAAENKTRLYAGLAHDTKTPLTLISNYLDKLRGREGFADELSGIKENFDRLISHIDNFLDVDRLDKDPCIYDHDQVINISDLLGDRAAFFREAAASAAVEFETKIQDAVHVRMDPYAFDRIVNNLIENALKFTNPGGRIIVSLNKRSAKVELVVEDTGIGMSGDQAEHVFDLYYRAEHGRRIARGTGIGLAVVKGIVDGVGGEISVDSEPERGTRFTILLDACTCRDERAVAYTIPVPKKANVRIEDSAPNPERECVFVIEDNPEMALFLMDAMKKHYNVFYASDGKEALRKIMIIPKPSIIISDIMMHDMNGYELYDRLLRLDDYADIPFVFLTAKNSKKDRLKGLGQGAIGFISKPFDIEELLASVRSIISYTRTIRKTSTEKNTKKILRTIRKKIRNDSALNIDENCVKYNISKRERQIIELLFKGKMNKEICSALDLSYNTVRNHISNIYDKCNAQSRVELYNILRKPVREEKKEGYEASDIDN